ncbi:hypothetical protein [Thermanaeromonas toyohensis]|uniref:hypothetical protein n=1 Tax=Thermanaeromonas toyohensis TaxID=161154 RepID=UPI000A0694CA|nr:hypothetical protein [Thermanaeromonas toyohensis]
MKSKMRRGAKEGYERKQYGRAFSTGHFLCAPGMGVNLVVRVHCRRGSTSLLAEGKGVHREVESEGSRRQSHGPMNKNPIRG